MNIISPEIKKFSKKIEVDSSVIGRFLSHNIVIFVEDKKRGHYYKKLLTGLYPTWDKKISIIDTQKGKTGVLETYHRSSRYKEEKNKYYILDKDFDDKYPEQHPHFTIKNSYSYLYKHLKKHSNFLIWDRYCIENYFISISLLKDVICSFSACSLCEKDIEKILKYVDFLSKNQLRNQLAFSKRELNYVSYIESSTLRVDWKKLLQQSKEILLAYKHSNFCNYKYTYIKKCDINAKKVLELIISWCSSSSIFSDIISQNSFSNLLLDFSLKTNTEDILELKQELDKIIK